MVLISLKAYFFEITGIIYIYFNVNNKIENDIGFIYEICHSNKNITNNAKKNKYNENLYA